MSGLETDVLVSLAQRSAISRLAEGWDDAPEELFKVFADALRKGQETEEARIVLIEICERLASSSRDSRAALGRQRQNKKSVSVDKWRSEVAREVYAKHQDGHTLNVTKTENGAFVLVAEERYPREIGTPTFASKVELVRKAWEAKGRETRERYEAAQKVLERLGQQAASFSVLAKFPTFGQQIIDNANKSHRIFGETLSEQARLAALNVVSKVSTAQKIAEQALGDSIALSIVEASQKHQEAVTKAIQAASFPDVTELKKQK